MDRASIMADRALSAFLCPRHGIPTAIYSLGTRRRREFGRFPKAGLSALGHPAGGMLLRNNHRKVCKDL